MDEKNHPLQLKHQLSEWHVRQKSHKLRFIKTLTCAIALVILLFVLLLKQAFVSVGVLSIVIVGFTLNLHTRYHHWRFAESEQQKTLIEYTQARALLEEGSLTVLDESDERGQITSCISTGTLSVATEDTNATHNT